MQIEQPQLKPMSSGVYKNMQPLMAFLSLYDHSPTQPASVILQLASLTVV